MLDKQVIKYTRNGIQQENLATGNTKMLTQSNYGKELKYASNNKEQKFVSKSDNIPSQSILDRRISSQNSRASPVLNMNLRFTYGSYNPVGNNEKGYKTKHYYTAKANKNKIRTREDLRGDALKHIRSRIIRKANNAILNDLKESDNVALEGVGTSTQSAIQIRHGLNILHSLRNHNLFSYTYVTDKKTEVESRNRASAYKAAYVRKKPSHTAKASQEATKQAGKAAQFIGQAGRAIVNPATIKIAAIAGSMLLLILIITQSVTSAFSSVVGSVTDHPELTSYVMQLDSEFQDKITALSEEFNRQDHTDVTIEGEDLVNTDPNELAILVTGDWTVLNLTPENKKELSGYHAVLNTYSVSKVDETKQSTSSDGTPVSTTFHHVTIQISVYTARQKIDSFTFSDEQKAHVLQMLDFLDQINADIQGKVNTGGQGSIAQGEFIWAVPGHMYISSGYGTRVDPISGESSAFHTGLDIPAPTGTSVVASADGTVIRSGVNGGFGNCVIIQHKNGIQTLYGHNSELLVKVGDSVKQGQVIAKVGQTGRATGPHCHFEFRINGKHVNPAPYLKEILGNED